MVEPINPNFALLKFARRAGRLNPNGFKRARRGNPDGVSDVRFGIKKILYITMSNLGDCLMGLPAFDFLRQECPQALITVVAGPRVKCVFEHRQDVERLIVYDKDAPLRAKIKLFFELKDERFDCIVDLRDTFYRWALAARYKNPAWLAYPGWLRHSNQKHLYKVMAALKRSGTISEDEFFRLQARRDLSFIRNEDEDYIDGLLARNAVARDEDFILVVPGARSSLKKWRQEGFVEVIKELREKYGYKVGVAGDKADEAFVQKIIAETRREGVFGVLGQTNFWQLCALIKRAKLIICNDSGALHIASYLDKPVAGIYGPSDYRQYGPWSSRGLAVRKDLLCSPCGKAHCRYNSECIRTVSPFDVVLAARLLLEGREGALAPAKYRRILVARTDRIGDVVLSTPVLSILRRHYPTSFLAIMVSVYTKDLVSGNPYLDEVITLDKDVRDRGFFATLALSRKIKRYGFDAAIILHPTLRVHLLMFLAGIRERIGYDRKAAFFLTKRIPHRKQEGARHEVEYNLDLLKPLGIEESSRDLYLPIKKNSEEFVDKLCRDLGLRQTDKLVAINPAASCHSRFWPLPKFAEVIDALIDRQAAKILIIADAGQRFRSQELARLTKFGPFDLSGRFNLSQLASLLKRCALLISNDSGPVHMAVALGTPVISIFGRNQPGLGPRRWGPLGPRDAALHKKTDCSPCLAHDCANKFQCLEAIEVREVLEHAERILRA